MNNSPNKVREIGNSNPTFLLKELLLSNFESSSNNNEINQSKIVSLLNELESSTLLEDLESVLEQKLTQLFHLIKEISQTPLSMAVFNALLNSKALYPYELTVSFGVNDGSIRHVLNRFEKADIVINPPIKDSDIQQLINSGVLHKNAPKHSVSYYKLSPRLDFIKDFFPLIKKYNLSVLETKDMGLFEKAESFRHKEPIQHTSTSPSQQEIDYLVGVKRDSDRGNYERMFGFLRNKYNLSSEQLSSLLESSQKNKEAV